VGTIAPPSVKYWRAQEEHHWREQSPHNILLGCGEQSRLGYWIGKDVMVRSRIGKDKMRSEVLVATVRSTTLTRVRHQEWLAGKDANLTYWKAVTSKNQTSAG
jgi:hypothetical protein